MQQKDARQKNNYQATHNYAQASKNLPSWLLNLYQIIFTPIYYFDVLCIPLMISFLLISSLDFGFVTGGLVVIVLTIGTWLVNKFFELFYYPKAETSKLYAMELYIKILFISAFILLWGAFGVILDNRVFHLEGFASVLMMLLFLAIAAVWLYQGFKIVATYFSPRGIIKEMVLCEQQDTPVEELNEQALVAYTKYIKETYVTVVLQEFAELVADGKLGTDHLTGQLTDRVMQEKLQLAKQQALIKLNSLSTTWKERWILNTRAFIYELFNQRRQQAQNKLNILESYVQSLEITQVDLPTVEEILGIKKS